MITVTSTNGRAINLEIVGDDVVASSGNIKFAAVLTSAGISSRFVVPAAGNRNIDVALIGPEMDKASALFSSLSAAIDESIGLDREMDDFRAVVIKGMNA